MRAIAEHPVDFFIGRDFQQRFVFIVEVDFFQIEKTKLPELSEIKIVLNPINQKKSQLVLILMDTEQFDIFRILCCHLIDATTDVKETDGKGLISIIINRLNRWQSLLQKARDKKLGKSEIIGLLGELFFLKEIVMAEYGLSEAVRSWRGPYGDEQDFLLNRNIVEVKTQLSTSDQSMLINSESQLDDISGPIFLVHQALEGGSDKEIEAFSLNSMVDFIKEKLEEKDPGAIDIFEMGLLEVGYTNHKEYGKNYHKIGKRAVYRVADGFPRIVAADLKLGVSKVRYKISVTACDPFIIDEEDFRKLIVTGDENG
tara:strand:- start:39 stop:980 length:942 start_codon:yes stop_codon:yes gene_type:complete